MCTCIHTICTCISIYPLYVNDYMYTHYTCMYMYINILTLYVHVHQYTYYMYVHRTCTSTCTSIYSHYIYVHVHPHVHQYTHTICTCTPTRVLYSEGGHPPHIDSRPNVFQHATKSQLQAFWGPKSHQKQPQRTQEQCASHDQFFSFLTKNPV